MGIYEVLNTNPFHVTIGILEQSSIATANKFESSCSPESWMNVGTSRLLL